MSYINACPKRTNAGFTLAEMMVVLLILSIVLAAMAPVITTRMKRGSSPAGAGGSTVWQWAANNVDAYFGADSNQTAMIGQSTSDSGSTSRLTINTSDNKKDHIQFKNGDNVLGRLTLDGSNLILGNVSSIGESNIIVGNVASSGSVGKFNVVIGQSTSSSAEKSVAIGHEAKTSANFAIAIGRIAETAGNNSIAIGYGAKAAKDNMTALGADACYGLEKPNRTCIGANSGHVPNNYNGAAYHTDADAEVLYIGSKSNFNEGPAIVEIINGNQSTPFNGLGENAAPTGLVVNGNLFVKGMIFTGAYDHPNTVYRLDTGEYDAAKLVSVGTGEGSNSPYKKSPANPSTASYYSDKRLKYVGQEFNSGLDKIRQIKVFNYTFKKDAAKEPRVGVIAQDLQKIFPNAVKKGSDGFLTIRMEDMFYAVINAIKELDTKVTSLTKMFKQLQDENAKLKKENRELKARLDRLEARIK